MNHCLCLSLSLALDGCLVTLHDGQIKRSRLSSFFRCWLSQGGFFVGRMIQYLVFGIYSSFDEKPLETVLWCLLTGIAISCVTAWLNLYIHSENRIKRALILGGMLFGVDLFLFNFFMPLVFDANIPDLILRTFIDILAVTVGCLAFPNQRNVDPAD